MDIQKLQKLQAQVRIGGKGTARRKVKKVVKAPGADDKRLQTTLSKMNSQVIPQIEEVNMFKSDGRVLHFQAPRGNCF
jgi:nascent polypeptide-associated complex subunit beta